MSSHKRSGTRLYNIWNGMKQRCRDKNHIKYKNYGARGIRVCDDWLHDFMNFYNWARLLNIPETTLRSRHRRGWPDNECLMGRCCQVVVMGV